MTGHHVIRRAIPILLLAFLLPSFTATHQERATRVTRGDAGSVTAANETSRATLNEVDNEIKFCPIGKCRFYAQSEEEMVTHVTQYHGINNTDYWNKVGGSKKCMAKIIYRRKTSVWHARVVSIIKYYMKFVFIYTCF